MAPDIGGIREAPLYVDDIDAAADWYNEVLGLETAFRGDSYCFLDCGGTDRGWLGSLLDGFLGRDEPSQQYAILFDPSETTEQEATPPHGAAENTHLALEVEYDALDDWRERLEGHGVDIEQETVWDFGDHSIYFRDPADNSIELYAEREG